MNEQETGFRTQIVGGFQRDDVLRYIEQTSRTYTEKIETLERTLSESESETEEQRSRAEALAAQNNELSSKDAELLERLGAMTLTEDTLRTALAETQAQLDQQSALVKTLTEENNILHEENTALSGELAELRRKCREYESAKEHMAEIELRAYRQAKEIEKKSRDEAERVKSEASAVVEQFRQRLCGANDNYRSALRRAQEELSEMHQRTNTLLECLEAAAAQLGSDKRKKENSVFSSLRRKDEK